MPPDPRAQLLLADIRSAVEVIQGFSATRSIAQYEQDEMLRSAVERQLIIVGEAVSQLAHVDADLVQALTDRRGMRGLRNRLVHEYRDVDHQRVWNIIQSHLPRLLNEVATLLEDPTASA